MPEQPLNITRPPDEVFKYVANRQAPAASVVPKKSVMFRFDHIEYPESGGQLVWFKDVPFPSKGHPFPEAIYAVNAGKRITIRLAKFLANRDLFFVFVALAFSKKRAIISRAIDTYRDGMMLILTPYLMAERYMSPFGRELRSFINAFLWKLNIPDPDRFSEIFVNLIDYDNAYRFRVQDAMSEMTYDEFYNDPINALKKVMKIIVEREPSTGVDNLKKFNDIIRPIRILLHIPKVKKAFRHALRMSTFANFQADEGDKYHMLLWADYNFMGKTIEERIQMYRDYHEKNPPVPQQIEITVQ